MKYLQKIAVQKRKIVGSSLIHTLKENFQLDSPGGAGHAIIVDRMPYIKLNMYWVLQINDILKKFIIQKAMFAKR